MKKPKKKVKRKVSYKTEKRKLDDIFSKFIRWRAADSDGNVQCVTCGKIAEVSKMQNGHFMSRKHHSIRWHAYGNCNPQCYGCNIGGKGLQFQHYLYIDKKYGEGTSMRLLERSTVKRKYYLEEIIQLRKHYKKKVDEYINKHS
mgnify:FL=1